MVLGIEPDRVEGIAGGLDADRAFDLACAQKIQRQRDTNGFDIDWMVKGTLESPTS